MGRVFAPLGRSRVGETVCHPGATCWSLGMSSPPQVEHLLCHFPEISILDQIWAGGLEKVLYLFLSSHYCIATLFWQRCFDLRNYLLQKNTSSTKGRQPCQYLGETDCHLITKCSGQWPASHLGSEGWGRQTPSPAMFGLSSKKCLVSLPLQNIYFSSTPCWFNQDSLSGDVSARNDAKMENCFEKALRFENLMKQLRKNI